MRPPGRRELDEQLRRQEGAARLDADAPQRLAPEELAGAVEVADAQAEEEPQAGPVDARVGQAEGRVGALDAVADHDVGGDAGAVAVQRALEQAPEVGDPELAVAVGEADERVARRRQAPSGPRRRSRG